MQIKEWIEFVEVENKNKKTKVWNVVRIDDKSKLGEVRWKNKWRRYWFEPHLQLEGLDAVCLLTIAQFIREQMDARKEKDGTPEGEK